MVRDKRKSGSWGDRDLKAFLRLLPKSMTYSNLKGRDFNVNAEATAPKQCWSKVEDDSKESSDQRHFLSDRSERSLWRHKSLKLSRHLKG